MTQSLTSIGPYVRAALNLERTTQRAKAESLGLSVSAFRRLLRGGGRAELREKLDKESLATIINAIRSREADAALRKWLRDHMKERRLSLSKMSAILGTRDKKSHLCRWLSGQRSSTKLDQAVAAYKARIEAKA